jgi:hypothetical protein
MLSRLFIIYPLDKLQLLKYLKLFKTRVYKLGLVVYTCNASYSGGRGKRIKLGGQRRQS